VRRWIALGSTSALFGLEHIALSPQSMQTTQQMIFTVSLGLLFGLLIMVSANLHFAAGMHAWINWLLLGAAPYFVDAQDQPALPAGTYIGLAMILAFVWSYVYRRLRHRP
jgi:sterol desaturase/sphingolipid hydroxylase (fatty acid hydroxylase superfamily)